MIYQYYVKSTTGLKFVTIWDEAKLVVVGQLGVGYALGCDFNIEVKRFKDLMTIANTLVKNYGYTILDNYMDRDEIERIKKQVRGY